MRNGKSSLSKRILTAVTAAAVMVPVLTVSLPAAAANAEPLTIAGQFNEENWQMNYVIPQDAPKTVILDGRDLMDMLVKRGEYNEMYPGTWTGGWFTLKNQSGYTYKVTDVEFALDHTQTQENSRVLSKLPYNPYESGMGSFFGTGRPDSIKNYNTCLLYTSDPVVRDRNLVGKHIWRKARKALCISKEPVPQTDTGR